MAGKNKDDERNARIIEAWNAHPELSAQGVGELCGVTRDIVCAVIYRARRQPENPVTRSGHQNKKPPKPKREKSALPKPPRQDVTELAKVSPYTIGLRVRELKESQCRYIVGDGEAFAFCEEVRADDRPYCAGHCRVCYRTAPKRTAVRDTQRRGTMRRRWRG